MLGHFLDDITIVQYVQRLSERCYHVVEVELVNLGHQLVRLVLGELPHLDVDGWGSLGKGVQLVVGDVVRLVLALRTAGTSRIFHYNRINNLPMVFFELPLVTITSEFLGKVLKPPKTAQPWLKCFSGTVFQLRPFENSWEIVQI